MTLDNKKDLPNDKAMNRENTLLEIWATNFKVWFFIIGVTALLFASGLWDEFQSGQKIVFSLIVIVIFQVHIIARVVLNLQKRIEKLEDKSSR